MISFIVIGKNEGWKLTKCFDSIFCFIKLNQIQNYEIIYVDSKSSDDSIVNTQKYNSINIFQITGDCNAAIARNIGANESKGDILFFIDGDMEIISDFYQVVFDENSNLKYEFVSGDFIDYNYDYSWNLLNQIKYHENASDKFEYTTGGIFIIRRLLWIEVNGMNTKFARNQDLDFGLRLSKIGYPLLRKKELIAKHHTIPYNDEKRKWVLLFSGKEFYPSVLFRSHYYFVPAIKIFIIENYTMIALVLCLFSFLDIKYLIFFYLYITLSIFKSVKSERKISIKLFTDLLKQFFRDIFRFFAFFIFWPKDKELKYIRIK